MATRLSRYRAAAPALVDQRSAQRHHVGITRASVRGLGEAPADAVLCDVSRFGCRLDAAEAHPAGERLWLRLGGAMPVAATVVWSEGAVIGCRFDAALAPALVRQLMLGAVA
jgi:hypothetical protein